MNAATQAFRVSLCGLGVFSTYSGYANPQYNLVKDGILISVWGLFVCLFVFYLFVFLFVCFFLSLLLVCFLFACFLFGTLEIWVLDRGTSLWFFGKFLEGRLVLSLIVVIVNGSVLRNVTKRC